MAGREPTLAKDLSKVKQVVMGNGEHICSREWQHFPQPGLLILRNWFVQCLLSLKNQRWRGCQSQNIAENLQADETLSWPSKQVPLFLILPVLLTSPETDTCMKQRAVQHYYSVFLKKGYTEFGRFPVAQQSSSVITVLRQLL